MRFALSSTVIKSDQVLSQEVSGETVLLDLSSEQYFGLDRVGTRFWQLLDGRRSLGEVIDSMLEEYDVSQEQLHSDVFALLEALQAAHLIEVHDS